MIHIRRAEVSDINIIADFQCKLAFETEDLSLEIDIVRQGLQALFSDPSKGQYFVAEYEGRVIACHLITYEWSEWRNGNVWWIQSVYVEKNFRGQHIFKRMYERLQQLAEADNKVLGLRLYVDKKNVKAQQVYNHLGMNGEHYTVFEWMKS